MPLRKIHAVGAAAAFALLAAALPTPASAAPSGGLVINEVFGGGGNSGATLTHDFIELANRSTAPIDLSGWSVQYHSRSGTGSWQLTQLTGTLAPGAYYLVQEAKGTGGTQPLPTPDATGTIPMSGTDGTVALVHGTTALTCTDATCGGEASIVDLLGYGTATIREGQPIPGASSTQSVQRTTAADSDDNSADFTAATPTPKASNGGDTPGPACPATPGALKIRDVQGNGWISPQNGKTVTDVPGIVTAVRGSGTRGFWIQDPAPDADPATSEAVLVFLGSQGDLSVKPGDAVMVSGKVSDYYPVPSGETFPNVSSLSTTEITNPTVKVCSSGNALPAAEVIAPTTLPGVYAPTSPTGNVESLVTVDPARSVLDFWESREGMLVEVDDARVIGAGNQYGEIYITAKPGEYATPRGGTVNLGYDKTPTGRIVVQPVSGSVPRVDVGSVLNGATSGPVDYSLFGGYGIAATTVGSAAPSNLVRESATPQAADQLAVATYNVENLSPKDPASKFTELAAGVVEHLASPDVVVLEEIQDNNGSTNDGVVDASQTLDKFVAAITAAGGPAYEWRQINPENGRDGGQPGGNIRVAFLFNPARVSFVDRAGGDSTTAVSVAADADGTAALSASPGRVDPANEAWQSSRKPLAGEFRFQGQKVIVVANHFNSKGGDQNADGRYQPPNRSSEIQRVKQATVLNAFLKDVLAVDARANIVVAGDINDYQYSPALATLTSNGEILTDLINTLPENERYSYVYNGLSQVLDHILISKPLSSFEYDVVHINAEFAFQTSDHDPQVVRLRPDKTPYCTQTLTGDHVGALKVTSGVLCIKGGRQIGALTIAPGAALIVDGGQLIGSVKSTGAAWFQVCGSKVTGSVSVSGSAGPVLLGGGNCAPNTITGSVSLSGNTGGVTVGGNAFTGALTCSGNNPPPTNGGAANRVTGVFAGQCSGL
ncbi:endonuclease [Actinorhabdospora filicis]|uniref:Endonuclease n=1 Tax=Actinorhabdospora filicis TaxID=1785913 RepID=A0A9W6SRR7_9ACTN|nr:lamin tail domain-containing protein [Actinorhabdospora filicis]GLZ80642.1 endonuclease [Actinorhabdospora filicis]